METVEVLVRIPKDLYEGIECRNGELETEYVCDELMKAVDNGTVLPKGHGRLIDADAATKDINAFQDAFAMYTDNMGKYNIVCAAPTVIEADEEKPNMMQQTMGFLKNLYLQNKDEIDRTAKEFYSKRNELTCIDLLEELRQQIWDITSKHLDSQEYALIRKADVLDIINQHLSDMQRNVPTVIEADKDGE